MPLRVVSDVTAFTPGDHVQVRPDAPHFAGRHGTIADSQARDGMPGHWLSLPGRYGEPHEHVWVPAAALVPLKGGAS